MQLSNSMYLNVEMTLRINRESAKGPVLLETTRANYAYLQPCGDPGDLEPLFVYQYNRRTPFPYPRCHLHVHARPQHYRGASFSRLHLPTRRITLEQVVWHLIQEHGVEPRRDDWHEVLWRHEGWFRDIQRDRDWPYDRPFDSPGAS
ncbi:MAG: hypothetical protein OXU21_04965 [Chloroflexota bacterium]|nr:hypothetical protein [Chloroflexota bacterium]